MRITAKEKIEKEFISLLSEKDIDDISITDIVSGAGVNRNSFYYHFKDIEDLLYSIVIQQAEEKIKEHSSIDSIEECIKALISTTLEHRTEIEHIYSSSKRAAYEQHVLKVCDTVIRIYAAALFSKEQIPAKYREPLIRFYRCECFGQIIEWLNSGMSYDIAEEFAILKELDPGMMQMFKN